jgi:hypothetical protein
MHGKNVHGKNMHGKDIGAVAAAAALAAVALLGACSASKKSAASATTAATASASATKSASAAASTATSAGAAAPSSAIDTEYAAAIAPVDKLRDEYEASKGTPRRAAIAPAFAASLRAFDAAAAKWPASGRTETDIQTMIGDDQTVASEVTANDLTVVNVDRDDAAHATVRADLGLPPA